jgi:hypothetical protein
VDKNVFQKTKLRALNSATILALHIKFLAQRLPVALSGSAGVASWTDGMKRQTLQRNRARGTAMTIST